jgi:hypothetical protein
MFEPEFDAAPMQDRGVPVPQAARDLFRIQQHGNNRTLACDYRATGNTQIRCRRAPICGTVASVRSLALLLIACAASPALAQRSGPPDVPEVPIEVPDPIPTGLLVAWKPAVLSVRLDTGHGSSFGSDTFQPLRAIGRFTWQLLGDKPFFGRVEVEGGRFETEDQGIGSTGTDVTGRLLAGAATRVTSGVLLIAGAGFLTRYQYGHATGGAPTIGMFGVASNIELDVRILPAVSVAGFLEGAIAPFPYAAQANLGDLSDASEVRARLQLSLDVSPSITVDLGYDFTRWHASFTGSTILRTTDEALLVETREHAATLGFRWHFRP